MKGSLWLPYFIAPKSYQKSANMAEPSPVAADFLDLQLFQVASWTALHWQPLGVPAVGDIVH